MKLPASSGRGEAPPSSRQVFPSGLPVRAGYKRLQIDNRSVTPDYRQATDRQQKSNILPEYPASTPGVPLGSSRCAPGVPLVCPASTPDVPRRSVSARLQIGFFRFPHGFFRLLSVRLQKSAKNLHFSCISPAQIRQNSASVLHFSGIFTACYPVL